MTSVITVSNLKKHFKITKHHHGRWSALRNLLTSEYRLVRAVDGISFEVELGELVGYIGPNGAGRQAHVSTIGAVFGQRTTLWWDLPVIESLDLLQHIYKVPPDRFRQNLDEFRELLELDPFLDTPVRSLSLGQRMRADLCAALLHDPALLFLDEPTIGLDVVGKERIRQFILHLNRQRGTTVILTTHDLSDVEKLCERVMIIDHGQLLYDGELGALRERFGGKRKLIVDFAQTYESVEVSEAQIIAWDGMRATYQFERGTVTASELIGRLSASYRIRDLQVREPEIEETVRRIYKERLLEN